MSLAFKAPIASTRKLVLLALCDSANDQGECYPSIPVLMEKSSLGERTVQDAIAALEASGHLRREFRGLKPTTYVCTPGVSVPSQAAHKPSRRGGSRVRGYLRFREAVLLRDGQRCMYCGCTDQVMTLDHILPRSKGGSDHLSNLVPACRPCNSSKGARTPEEWRRA